MRKITLLLLLCLALVGCATVKESMSGIFDYFSGGQDNAEPPTPLVEYTPELDVKVFWKESVGVGADGQTLKLIPAIGTGKIIAADRKGVVEARDAKLATCFGKWKPKYLSQQGLV